jgi:hypothetical protein
LLKPLSSSGCSKAGINGSVKADTTVASMANSQKTFSGLKNGQILFNLAMNTDSDFIQKIVRKLLVQ